MGTFNTVIVLENLSKLVKVRAKSADCDIPVELAACLLTVMPASVYLVG